MKTRETTPGKTYSVHTSSGCTVSDKNGWSKAIDAPDGYFTAHAGEVTIDGDDAADVREVFKLAPYQKLRLLGVVGGGVPAWFKALETELTALLDGSQFKLAWLSAKNTLVVHTDRVSDELSDAVTALLERVLPQNVEVVQYNHNMEISWRDMTVDVPLNVVNRYDECTSLAEVKAVNEDYINDLYDGAWGYPLTSLYDASQRDSWLSVNLFTKSKITRFSPKILPNLVIGRGMFTESNELTEIELKLPKCELLGNSWDGDYQGMFSACSKMVTATLDIPKATNARALFLLCEKLEYVELKNAAKLTQAWGICDSCKKLRVFKWGAVNVHYAAKGWNLCVLDKDSVLGIISALAVDPKGGTTTLGIHVDHQTDDEVLEAIANAEAKGWALTVQWNGTPTAQASVTYGLRKPPIYARVSELENGERYLDWGHYVTDPSGYEEFRSVEAAREYYGLPDEPLINN